MHKGVAGVANLNVELQRALGPFKHRGRGRDFGFGGKSRVRGLSPVLRAASGTYEVGDKIIQLRNNYDKNLFNGDIGVVTGLDTGSGRLTADFGGDEQVFERAELGDVALAHAITIHKSQGSEYPVVVVPLLKAHFMMLQRNLLYTAITRGRKRVYLVGDAAAYAMAVRNRESKLRCTHLREKIGQQASPPKP
jgi:exodeoxyribonuclease V alpha subunit